MNSDMLNNNVDVNSLMNYTEKRLNELAEECNKLATKTDNRIDAIYVRESTKRQAEEGFNLEGQERECKAFCEYKKLTNTKVYAERGASAKDTNRKIMNKLKDDVIKGKVKTVIVYKLDRLVRRLKGLSELLELFEEYDVKLMSVKEDFNTNTAMGKMIMNFIVMIAQWEEDTISERTIDGLVEGAMQGFYMKGNKPPFGYERHAVGVHSILKVNAEEKRIIRMMKDLLKSGYSMYMIKVIIEDDPYMKTNNKTFCENQLIKILKNKINIGIMTLNKKEYKLKMQETIFTNNEYKEVLQLLSEKGHDSKYNYLYGCKVRSTQGKQSAKKSTVKKSGAILYYYDAQLKKRINEKYITEAVIKHLRDTQVLYKDERKKTYEADLQALQSKKKHLSNAHDLGKITTETYKKELIALQKERNEIKTLKTKYVDCVGTYFNSLKHKQKERIIWKHINYIEVDYLNKEVTKIC